MSFGCCKHVLKVNVNLRDKKRNKKTSYTYIIIKSWFSQQRPTGKLQTLYCSTQDRQGNKKIWVFKIPPGGEQKCIWLTALIHWQLRMWLCVADVGDGPAVYGGELPVWHALPRRQRRETARLSELRLSCGQLRQISWIPGRHLNCQSHDLPLCH